MATHFPFAVDRRIAPLLRVWGFRPDADGVTLSDDGQFTATFGWFRIQTPVSNVAGVEDTGPYSLLKAVGVRMSLADNGLTFGTTGRSGACVSFHQPIDWIVPFRRHDGLTVTIADPDGLVTAIEDASRR